MLTWNFHSILVLFTLIVCAVPLTARAQTNCESGSQSTYRQACELNFLTNDCEKFKSELRANVTSAESESTILNCNSPPSVFNSVKVCSFPAFSILTMVTRQLIVRAASGVVNTYFLADLLRSGMILGEKCYQDIEGKKLMVALFNAQIDRLNTIIVSKNIATLKNIDSNIYKLRIHQFADEARPDILQQTSCEALRSLLNQKQQAFQKFIGEHQSLFSKSEIKSIANPIDVEQKLSKIPFSCMNNTAKAKIICESTALAVGGVSAVSNITKALYKINIERGSRQSGLKTSFNEQARQPTGTAIPMFSEVIAALGTSATHLGDIKKIQGLSIVEIVSRIPKEATVKKVSSQLEGFKFEWKDSAGYWHHVRIHGPDPSAAVHGPKSNSATGWTVRLEVTAEPRRRSELISLDNEGNRYQKTMVNGKPRLDYDESVLNGLHIPVQGHPNISN